MKPAARTVLAWPLRYAERSLDRLPKAAALVNGQYGRTVAAALQALLPERSEVERAAIIRGVVRHRLLNRAIEVFQTSFPALAVAAARLVPVVPSASAGAAMRDTATPLIMGSAHFGPLFFQLLVLRRLLRGRRVIVVLRGRALYLRKMVPFIRRIGYEPAVDDPHLLLRLRRALRDDPRTVVMIVLDHTRRGRHVVRFLGGALAASPGMGVLADFGATRVVSSFWEWNRGRARVVLEGPYAVDRSLPPAERRRRFLDFLYSLVEAKVAAFPDQWSGWYFVAPSLIAIAPHEAVS